MEEVKNLDIKSEEKACCETKKECCDAKKWGCHSGKCCPMGHKLAKCILAIVMISILLSIAYALGARHARNEGAFQNGYGKHMRGGHSGFIQNNNQGEIQGGCPMMRNVQGGVRYDAQGSTNGQVFEITTQGLIPAQGVTAAVNSQPVQVVPNIPATQVKPIK